MRGEGVSSSFELAVALLSLPGPDPTVRDLHALAILVTWLETQTFNSAGFAAYALDSVDTPSSLPAVICSESEASGPVVIGPDTDREDDVVRLHIESTVGAMLKTSLVGLMIS